MALLRWSQRVWRPFAVRPGFSILVVGTLGLTVGAATAIFSIFDAVLLRPFPFPEADRLVRLRSYEAASPDAPGEVSLADYDDWRREARGLSGMGAWITFANNLTGMGPARSVRMTFASPELLSTVGVAAHRGRLFTPAENVAGGDFRKAVIGHGLWQELFAGRDEALGRTIELRGQTYEVIGVMPPRFEFPERTEVWVPLMARYATYRDEWWLRRDTRIHHVLARLAPGTSLESVQSELDGIASALRDAHPEGNRNVHVGVQTLRQAETALLRPYVLLVGAAVSLLLLIGCGNVAGLFVARSAARTREMALRTALGARLTHLGGQLLGESLAYAIAGGVLGVLVAIGSIAALEALVPVPLPDWMRFGLDPRVLLFTVAVTSLTAILFGLLPLAQHLRPNLEQVMRQGGKGAAGGSLSVRLRRALLVGEVALAVLLLVGAGLMLRSLDWLSRVDTGLRSEGAIVATAFRYLPNVTRAEQVTGYADEFRRMRQALASLPGVASVSGGSQVPFVEAPEVRPTVELYTRRRATRDEAYRGAARGADVMPGYFAALGIPLLAGRDFTEADEIGAEPVVIISRRTAEVLFPGEPALGQQMRWGNDSNFDPWMTVVGVVGNTRWQPAERQEGVEVDRSVPPVPGTLHAFRHADAWARRPDHGRGASDHSAPERGVRRAARGTPDDARAACCLGTASLGLRAGRVRRARRAAHRRRSLWRHELRRDAAPARNGCAPGDWRHAWRNRASGAGPGVGDHGRGPCLRAGPGAGCGPPSPRGVVRGGTPRLGRVRRRCGSARDGCRHRLPGPSLEGIAHRTDRRASGECLTAGTQS